MTLNSLNTIQRGIIAGWRDQETDELPAEYTGTFLLHDGETTQDQHRVVLDREAHRTFTFALNANCFLIALDADGRPSAYIRTANRPAYSLNHPDAPNAPCVHPEPLEAAIPTIFAGSDAQEVIVEAEPEQSGPAAVEAMRPEEDIPSGAPAAASTSSPIFPVTEPETSEPPIEPPVG